jgi:peptidyl-prolyl cis-trans isomerase D
MFDLFRSRDKMVRIVLGALLLLVAASMLLYLVPGGPTGGARNTDDQIMAEVGGEPITAQEVESRIQIEVRRGRIPESVIYAEAPQLMQSMIRERAMAYEAHRLGIEVSDADLANELQAISGGQFSDRNTYERYVSEQGMTIPQFEFRLRQGELAARLQMVAAMGQIVLPDEVHKAFVERNEKVKLQYVLFSPAMLKEKINPTPADLENYFNRNRGFFNAPETRDLDVLVIDQDKVAAGIQLSDDQLRNWYSAHMDQFRIPERVHARHILFTTTGKTPDEVNKIKAQAEDVLKQAKAGGDFAALAAKYSQDPGSASKGGDVGWVIRGQMVPNFEKAVFSLKPNEISNLVTTEYGFHIVQALAHEQAHVKSFEEARPEIVAELKNEMVADRMQTLGDEARAALVKAPQNAAQIGSKLGIPLVSLGQTAPGAALPGVGSDRDVMAAIGDLKVGEVSQVLSASPTRQVIVTVRRTNPSHPAEFADVKDQIRRMYIDQRAGDMARDDAKKAADVAKVNGDMDAAAKATGTTAKTTDDFTRYGAAEGLGQAAHYIEAFTKPVGTVLGPLDTPEGMVVVKVIAKTPADESQFAAQRERIVEEIKQRRAQDDDALFEDSIVSKLMSEGKIKLHIDVMKRILERHRA